MAGEHHRTGTLFLVHSQVNGPYQQSAAGIVVAVVVVALSVPVVSMEGAVGVVGQQEAVVVLHSHAPGRIATHNMAVGLLVVVLAVLRFPLLSLTSKSLMHVVVRL